MSAMSCTTGALAALLLFLPIQSKIVNPGGYFPYATDTLALRTSNSTSKTHALEGCDIAFKMALVQDVTGSYGLDMELLKSEIAGTYDSILEEYPNSDIALSMFTDKPVEPLGLATPSFTDYCYTVWSPFGAGKAHFLSKLASLSAGGGNDWAEAQADAMLRAALNKKINWPQTLFDPATKFAQIKVLVLATNSGYHLADNLTATIEAHNANPGSGVLPPAEPNTLLKNPELLDADVNAKCTTMEYPSTEQLGYALRKERIIPVFLVSPSVYECGEGLCVYPELEDAVGPDVGIDGGKGMLELYTRFAKDLGVVAVVEPLGISYERLREKILLAAEEIHHISCIELMSTTTTTTTETTTTLTEPTTTLTEPTTTLTEPTTTPATTTTVAPPVTPCDPACKENCKVEVKVVVKVNGRVQA